MPEVMVKLIRRVRRPLFEINMHLLSAILDTSCEVGRLILWFDDWKGTQAIYKPCTQPHKLSSFKIYCVEIKAFIIIIVY